MTLFFIHGSGCTGRVFDQQREAFADSVAITLPGHFGDGVAGPERIADFADIVMNEIDRMSLHDVVLCGSSMGGAIALEAAFRYDSRIRGVVLIGSGAKLRVGDAVFERLQTDFPAAARWLARMFFADALPERIDAAVELMLHVGKHQTLRDFHACNAFDASDRVEALPVPLLAIVGERDVLMPPKFSEWIAGRVPQGSSRILAGAGHLAMIERAAETNDLLRSFRNEMTTR